MAKEKKIFLSGPSIETGNELDHSLFRKVEETILWRGDIPVIPQRMNAGSSFSEIRKSMRDSLKELLDCDGIYMINGWKSSKEAKLERFVALKTGMSVEVER